ncbi:Rv3654c family TadE-like protein [Streptomyces sp. NPDC058247]|uniref:Rv3654c family TadE-like protein n=1 Tax=Streptomyces sp. NPDC058247 TaxID=3346401 RepID=UPI0036DFBBA5
MKRRRAAGDRGSATVWAVMAMAALGLVFGCVLTMGQAVVVRHRAGGAADLAALAAADHWMEGRKEACAHAGRVAAAQDTRLVSCAVYGEVSDVTAAAGAAPLTTEVRARAGPAGPVAPEVPTDPAGADPAGPEVPADLTGSVGPAGSGVLVGPTGPAGPASSWALADPTDPADQPGSGVPVDPAKPADRPAPLIPGEGLHGAGQSAVWLGS